MFLGLWAVRTLLSLPTVMGFSITTSNGVLAWDLPPITSNGVLAWDLPPITSNCSDMVCFQPVSSALRLLSHLMCLTISHGCHGMQDCGFELFPKAEKVHK